MAIVLQIILASYVFRYLACIMAFALGAFLFTITLIKEGLNDLVAANNDVKRLKSGIDMFQKLSRLTKLHSDGKQLRTISYKSLKLKQ